MNAENREGNLQFQLTFMASLSWTLHTRTDPAASYAYSEKERGEQFRDLLSSDAERAQRSLDGGAAAMVIFRAQVITALLRRFVRKCTQFAQPLLLRQGWLNRRIQLNAISARPRRPTLSNA